MTPFTLHYNIRNNLHNRTLCNTIFRVHKKGGIFLLTNLSKLDIHKLKSIYNYSQ
ncbi:class I SAM-dependent methyltransferase [Orenia marismortui]|uniref:class I SAM-dependent methyltransferase n=1 Tax=Orenia marismortui TaxID=46469 RepID=UPI003B84829E